MPKRRRLARSIPSGTSSGLEKHTSSPARSFSSIHGKLSLAETGAGGAGTPGRHQLWVSSRSPSSLSWKQRAPVKIERLDDAALSLLDRSGHVRGRQIDEPHRQLTDKLLEVQPLGVRCSQRIG